MTNNLKTLKDLEAEYYAIGINENIVPVPRLRAEAIKWVKEDLRVMKEIEGKTGKGTNFYKYADARIDWIKHFFNLTEEDISNG